MKNINGILLLLIIFYSCENLNEPVGIQYGISISSLLEANRNIQEIQLFQALNLDDTIDYKYYGRHFIKGAQIKISENNNVYSNFALFEKNEMYNGKSFFYGNDSEFKIMPGNQYNLEIVADEIRITGVTTVPGDFQILEPSKNKMKIEDIINMELSWTKSDSAYLYSWDYRIAYQSQSDSSIYHGFKVIPLPSGNYTENERATFEYYYSIYMEIDSLLISITAYDKNAYNHFIKEDNNAGVTNAYGVFGSSVTKTAVIVIDKE